MLRSDIRGDHDLFASGVKSIEDVVKNFLGTFFPSEELNIVEHEHIDILELILELVDRPVSDGVDYLVDKGACWHVKYD
jgi:hypothetical protein